MTRIVLTLLLATFAGNALAANINIGPNGCSLADAIKSANSNSAHGNCAPGSGTDIIIAPDGWVVTLSSDLPTITSNMTIRSASSAGIFTIDGNHERRLLKITGSNTNVTLLRVQLRNGSFDPSGNSYNGTGILINNATVRLENSSLVSSYEADIGLGAIYVDHGDLTIDQSTVKGNANRILIYTDNSSVHIVDSVFKQNTGGIRIKDNSSLMFENSLSESGGYIALSVEDSSAAIVNSTFTSSVSLGGSYILYFDTALGVTLNHVTVGEPIAFYNGGIYSISNSLIGDCENANQPHIVLNTGNLYQSTQGGAQNCLGLSPHDYSLLPLADNGGPTMTRAFGDPSSAAIGAGDPAYCANVDQRGEARGAVCDVGAYEATGSADLAVTASIDPGAPYVSEQDVVVVVEIANNGPRQATNVRLDMAADNAFITGTQSAFCTEVPCVIPGIQPGQTVGVPVKMSLASYFDSPFLIDVSAHSTANSTYYDANEDDPAGDNFFSLSHVINPGADLALTMNLVTTGPYYAGQTIQYEALISNAGPQTASGTQLQFTPDHLANVVFSGCASVSGFTCNVSNIASGHSRTVGIQAKITDDQFNAIGAVSATQVDIHPDDNVDDRNNGGGVAKSDVTIQANIQYPGLYYSYDYVEVDIFISTGNEPASNIQVDYDFPGAEFINIQPCGGIPCIIPQLAANSSITLTAQFFAPIAMPGVVETLDFHAEAWPGQTDSHPTDNQVALSKDLYPVADVAPKLTLITMPPFIAGQQIEYALQVINGGLNAANSVHVTMNPDNLTLINSYGDLCPTVPCTISRLNAFDQENITLVYRIDEAGAFDLFAAAHANEHDSNTVNNHDSSNNGGMAIEPPNNDLIFADDFEPSEQM